MSVSAFEKKCVNTVRLLAADMVEKANSGHPGAPMGCAPMAATLFGKIMRYNPANPKWINRDRFILSNGHACALLYSMLHLTGYDGMTIEDLKKFRQIDSVTAGHPENIMHAGIEVSTGPLGQGISNAVGIAIAERHLAATFNTPAHPNLIDNRTYVICGDGCLQEGVASEACSLAGHLGLGKLCVLYDDNKITIDGETHLSFTEDVLKRFEAYGWHTQTVPDGDTNYAAIEAAIHAANAVLDKPSIIKVATTIGYGAPKKQGKEKAHGEPLGKEELAAAKTAFGFDPAASFVVDEDVRAFFHDAGKRGAAASAAWEADLAAYSVASPAAAAEFTRRLSGALPEGWMTALPRYKASDKADATRNLSNIVLNAIAPVIPELVGGSADLTGSNKTLFKGAVDFQAATPAGRYIRYGVREHAMAAICNGMASYGGIIPYNGTFLNFIGYALGAVRLSALSHFRVIYIATHDSIGLGEDGPTHQPIEMMEALRATPNTYVYRPADGNETSACYACAITNSHAPAIFALSRQNLPHLEGSTVEKAMQGGYRVFETAPAAATGTSSTNSASSSGAAGPKPHLIIAATGSEVATAIDAAKKIAAANGGASHVAVVSFPCLEVFEKQSAEYKASVLPEGVPVLTVEAACVRGWERYGHGFIGMRTFGFSGPYLAAYEKAGITVDTISAKGAAMIEYYKTHPVGTLAIFSPF